MQPGDYIMWLRILTGCVLAVSLSTIARGQPQWDINNRTDLPNSQDWKVSYAFNEIVHFPKAYRNFGAVRLHIEKQNDQPMASLWLFTAKNAGMGNTSYEFYGKTGPVPVKTTGTKEKRHRIAFYSKDVPLKNKDGTPLASGEKVIINGVWQPGRDTTTRENQRIQLKVHCVPSTAPGPSAKTPSMKSGSFGNCEDDPDTDVLEEGEAPADPNDPPPDDPPPC
jgi:hypothetical protein